MSRLIDADKLDMRDDSCGCAYDAKIIIKNAPTVDAVEVVHGEWIECKSTDFRDNDNFFKCSICGRIERKQEPYCNCGAKMEKKVTV